LISSPIIASTNTKGTILVAKTIIFILNPSYFFLGILPLQPLHMWKIKGYIVVFSLKFHFLLFQILFSLLLRRKVELGEEKDGK